MDIHIILNREECEENPYFKSKNPDLKFFVDFQIKFNSIYRYFHLNSLFLSQYFKESHENLKTLIAKDDKDLEGCTSCFFNNLEGFKEIHNMSTLMILYTDFEALLKKVTKDIAYDFNRDIEDIQQENLPYINSYIKFLHEKFKPYFIMDNKEFEFINILRKIRNEFLHDSSSLIPENMKKELFKLMDKRDGNVVIDDFFLENIFELIGKISTQLQDSYLIYYKNYKK